MFISSLKEAISVLNSLAMEPTILVHILDNLC